MYVCVAENGEMLVFFLFFCFCFLVKRREYSCDSFIFYCQISFCFSGLTSVFNHSCKRRDFGFECSEKCFILLVVCLWLFIRRFDS